MGSCCSDSCTTAAMAFYVMHDTFICQKQQTNFYLKNSKRNEKSENYCQPTGHFENDKRKKLVKNEKKLNEYAEKEVSSNSKVNDKKTITLKDKIVARKEHVKADGNVLSCSDNVSEIAVNNMLTQI